jgi:CHAT domain-containing protein/tetratricopeptide (TPR) repeat protein
LLWSVVLFLCFMKQAFGDDHRPPAAPDPYPGLTAVQKERLKERDLFERRCQSLAREGKYPEAIKAAEGMLAVEREVLGRVHRDVAGSLELLARLRCALRHMTEARAAASELVDVRAELLGPAHWEVGGARELLRYVEQVSRLDDGQWRRLQEASRIRMNADRLERSGRHEEAAHLALSELAIYERLFGKRSGMYFNALHRLGLLLQARGNYIGAVPWFEEAVEVARQVYGGGDPSYATALGYLADALYLVGDLSRSQALLERGLDIRRGLGLTQRADHLSFLENLSKIRSETGHPEKARPVAEEALALVRRQAGEEHLRYANGLSLLGEILLKQRDIAGARRLFEREKDLLRRLVGEKHPKYAYCLNHLGRVLQEEGDLDGAKALYLQALYVFPETSRFPQMAVTVGRITYWNGVIHDNLESLARARQAKRAPERARIQKLAAEACERGDLVEAIRLRGQQARLLSEDFGVWSDELAACLEDEARLRIEAADFAGARKALGLLGNLLQWRLGDHWQGTDIRIRLDEIARAERLYPAARIRLKEVDSSIARAESLEREGWHEHSLDFWADALRLHRKILGADHPRTPVLMDRLGLALLHSGRPQAVPMIGSAMELSQKVIGEQLRDGDRNGDAQRLIQAKQRLGLFHPDTTLKVCHLIQALMETGQADQARNLMQQVLRFRRAADEGTPNTVHFLYDENMRMIGGESTGEQKEIVAGLRDSRPAKDVAANEALLDLQRKLYGPGHASVAETLDWLALRHEARRDYSTARRAREESYELKRRGLGEGHWLVKDARIAFENVESLASMSDAQQRYHRAGSMILNKVRFDASRHKLDHALSQMQEALRVLRLALGDHRPQYADALIGTGELLRAGGDLVGAEPLLSRALVIRREMFGEDHPATAKAVLALGKLSADQGRFVDSERLIRSASLQLQSLLGAGHTDFVESLDELASVCLKQGKYAEARAAITLAIRTVNTDRKDRVMHRFNILASLESEVGNHAEARQILEMFVKNREEEKKRIESQYLERLGNGAQAKAWMERLTREREEPESPEYLQVLSTLARAMRDGGDVVGAKALMERVLSLHHDDPRTEGDRMRIAIDGPKGLSRHHPLYAERLQDLAELCLSLGDLDRAASLVEQAATLTEELLGPEHPQFASRLSAKARVLAARGDLNGARSDAERAFRLAQQGWGEGHPVTTEAARVLARIHLTRSEPGAAQVLLADQLAAVRAAGRERHPDQPGLLSDLADSLVALGRIDAARPLLEQALELNTGLLGHDHPTNEAILRRMSLWHQAKGDPGNARRAALAALEVSQRYLSRNLGALSERETIAALGEVRRSLSMLLSLDPSAGVYPQVINLKGLAFSSARRMHRVDPDRRELLVELNRARTRIQEFYFSFPRGLDAEDFSRDFRGLVERRARLETELGKAAGWEPQTVGPASVLEALPAGTALIDLFRYTRSLLDPTTHVAGSEDRYVAFVVRAGSSPQRVELGPATPIDRLVEEWRQSVEHQSSEPGQVGLELARRIWKPLVPPLGEVTSLVISPDGDLGFLPWGALPDESPESYLIERYSFGTIGSARQLVEQPQSSPAPANGDTLLVAGYIDYDHSAVPLDLASINPGAPPGPVGSSLAASAGTARRRAILTRSAPVQASQLNFARLPRTAKEIDDISRLFVGSKLGRVLSITERVATKARIVESLPGKRYVHLATHGYFAPPTTPSALSPQDPAGIIRPYEGMSPSLARGYFPGLLSGLVFAGVNSPPTGPLATAADLSAGVMTAEEVAGLDLSACELATLSACQTGLGKVAGGEGILGLQRAFHQAGARTVVASLWTVDDAATQQLMTMFYDNMWRKGLTTSQAMHQAQLSMLGGERTSGPQDERVGPGVVVKSEARKREKSTPTRPRRPGPKLWAGWVVSGSPRR